MTVDGRRTEAEVTDHQRENGDVADLVIDAAVLDHEDVTSLDLTAVDLEDPEFITLHTEVHRRRGSIRKNLREKEEMKTTGSSTPSR